MPREAYVFAQFVSGGVKMYQNRRFKNVGIRKGVILREEVSPRVFQDSI
jgi:hypothetical protein